MGAKLPREQAAVFVALNGCLPVEKSADIISFAAPGMDARQYVMAARAVDEPHITVVSTLGSLTDRLFMTVTDGDPGVLAEVVARAEYHEARSRAIAVGHTLQLDIPSLAESGWVGILFGVPEMLELLESVPDRLSASGRECRLLLCILLNDEEYDLKRSGGVDALLDRFEETSRDLVAFRPQAGRDDE